MKKLILILIALAAITEGCQKYEDGPWISLRSAKNRLYGTYDLTTYTVNGVDSLSLYNDSLSLIFEFAHFRHDNEKYCFVHGFRKDGLQCGFAWKWNLDKKNKFLQIYSSDGFSIGTGPFGINKLPEWEISRLTNKEVNMKTIYNGKEYYVELCER